MDSTAFSASRISRRRAENSVPAIQLLGWGGGRSGAGGKLLAWIACEKRLEKGNLHRRIIGKMRRSGVISKYAIIVNNRNY